MENNKETPRNSITSAHQYYSLTEARNNGSSSIVAIAKWLEEFLGQPHAALQAKGYHGSVCPFTPRVLAHETVSIAALPINPAAKSFTGLLEKIVVSSASDFFKTEAVIPENIRHLACLLLIVEGIETSKEMCELFVSKIQKKLQPEFVGMGLLLSELHPHSDVPSVRAANFFPSRPPFPLFFIRRLIAADIPYLLRRDRYDQTTYDKIFSGVRLHFSDDAIRSEMKRLGKKV